jgi:hypothetical protein
MAWTKFGCVGVSAEVHSILNAARAFRRQAWVYDATPGRNHLARRHPASRPYYHKYRVHSQIDPESLSNQIHRRRSSHRTTFPTSSHLSSCHGTECPISEDNLTAIYRFSSTRGPRCVGVLPPVLVVHHHDRQKPGTALSSHELTADFGDVVTIRFVR